MNALVHKNNMYTYKENFNLHVHAGMGKQQKQELGWRVSALHTYSLHSTTVSYCIINYYTYIYSIQWNTGMGNTDTFHRNSCLSIPTSRIKCLLLVDRLIQLTVYNS